MFARQVLESYFLRKGEDFARAAVNQEPHKLDEVTLRSVAQSMASLSVGVTGRNPIQLTCGILENVLISPSSETDEYLNLLLQSYTLFAFLAATPDVQKATRNMFGSGEIWLDTTAILPLFAEVSSEASRRPLTAMFAQCRNAGLRLLVTSGVIEEVERHINRCRAFTHAEKWIGEVPFLYAAFAFHGGKRDGFSGWIERFSGERDPTQDIADYLLRKHHIRVESAAECQHVNEELARAVRDVWREIHVSRRGSDMQALRLAEHDSENYLHILSSRIGQKGRAPLGYSDWWLTLDGAARSILDKVDARLRPRVNVGPVMSIDYLLRYLAFGPARDKTDFSGAALSKIYAGTILESIPPELLEVVDRIRSSHADLEEHIIERRIRDGLNDERSKIGNVQSAGLSGANAAIDMMY